MPNSRDVEYGRTPLLEKWDQLNISPNQVKRFLAASFVACVSVYMSFAYRTIDANVVSIQERTYSPFSYSDRISTTQMTTVNFPILHSYVNRELQKNNLRNLATHVRKYLNETKSACIHAKYFEVPYEIIIIPDHIIINPSFESMSTQVLNAKVSDPFGREKWISYPETCKLKYLDGETLETITREFRKLDTLCFHFYLHHNN